MKKSEMISKNTLDYRLMYDSILDAFVSKIKSIGSYRTFTVNPKQDPTAGNRITATVVIPDYEELQVYEIEVEQIYDTQITVNKLHPEFKEFEFGTEIKVDRFTKKDLVYKMYFLHNEGRRINHQFRQDGIGIRDFTDRNISAKEHLEFLIKILTQATTIPDWERDNFQDPMGCLADYE